MNSFQAIKEHLFQYEGLLESIEPSLFNDQLVQSAIQQLAQFRESLGRLDRHPLKIKPITSSEKTEMVACLNKIGDIFQERVEMDSHVITIFNESPLTEEVLEDLVAYSKIGQLHDLAEFAKTLDGRARFVSSAFAKQIDLYKEGPLTAASAREVLEALSEALNLLGPHLMGLTKKLGERIALLNQWNYGQRNLPPDFVLLIKQDVDPLFDVLAKISDALVFHAENLHPVMKQLSYTIEPPAHTPIDQTFCRYGNQILDQFRQMDALTKHILKRLKDDQPACAILFYNIYRLQVMIRSADKMVEDLPKNVEKSLNDLAKQAPYIEQLAHIAEDPSLDPISRSRSIMLTTKHQQNHQRLVYSQTHIDELKEHAYDAEARACLALIQYHPKTAPFFIEETFPAPLIYENDWWLLQRVQLHSMKDVETFYHAIQQFSQQFFALQSIFRGKSSENRGASTRNPWIPLAKLKEMIAKL